MSQTLCQLTEPAATELDFAQGLVRRSRERSAACLGPLIALSLSAPRVEVLEDILGDLETVLWGNFFKDHAHGLSFRLCAAHWCDVAMAAWLGSLQTGDGLWLSHGRLLLAETCAEAGWDPKEMTNMLLWQKSTLRLT